MKIIKKALIVTSALALGFIVTGCNKKSIMIDKNKVYNKDNVDRESFKNFDNVLSVDVKKYSNFGSRFIRYITTNNETVVFDYIAKNFRALLVPYFLFSVIGLIFVYYFPDWYPSTPKELCENIFIIYMDGEK